MHSLTPTFWSAARRNRRACCRFSFAGFVLVVVAGLLLPSSHVRAADTYAIVPWGFVEGSIVLPDAAKAPEFVQIAGGHHHFLALRDDGTLVAWGDNVYGELSVPSGLRFTAIDASDANTLGLLSDGTLACWGRDLYGLLSPPGGNDFIAIAASIFHHLALKADGTIVGWGYNEDGRANPPTDNTGYKAIAAGRAHNVALKQDGTIVSWGNDDLSQVSGTPMGAGFIAIAAGDFHSLALRGDGTLVSWGADNGQVVSNTPVGGSFTAIAAGPYYNLALRTDGTLAGWGDNTYGQATPPTGSGFKGVAAGTNTALALRDVGGVPPVPVITAPPQYGIVISENWWYDIRVGVFGDESQVASLRVYINNNVLREQTAPPWSLYFPDAKPVGVYTIVAEVTRTDNSVARSDRVSVIVYTECFFETLMAFNTPTTAPAPAPAPVPAATSTSGVISWMRRAAQSAAVTADDLALLRRFRDEVLVDSPVGHYCTDIYARMGRPLLESLVLHPDLLLDLHTEILEWLPVIQAVVDGNGAAVQITPQMVQDANALLLRVRAVATPELAAFMDAETVLLAPVIDPATFPGMTADQFQGLFEAQVRPAPAIATHPLAASVTSGGNVNFSVAVEAVAAGPLTYQWFKDGVEIPGATGATYTVPSAQSFHAGDYTVTVSNPFGDTSSDTANFAVNAPPANNGRLLNLSTRARALTGSNILIPGFVVSGSASKRLLIRAVGPTLANAPYNVPGTLANPRLALKRFDSSRTPPAYVDVDANDDWQANTNAAAIMQAVADLSAFAFEDDREAALLVDLIPGQYTVFADGVADATGIAIVELYDADADGTGSRLINISNRGFVGTGAQVMIPGFVVSSEGSKTLLIRVVGPTLGNPPYNVPGAMVDPQLKVFPAGSNTPILTNDNWGDNPDAAFTASTAQAVGAFALAAGSADAAFVVTLPPGAYTAVGSSADGSSTGVVLMEVYVVP